MYTSTNFKTKKALKEAILRGDKVSVFSPGLGVPPANGLTFVEGPHFPSPHTWYAKVTMKDGFIVKVQ